MITRCSGYFTLIGALVWLAAASAPIAAVDASNVEEMTPAELRAMFHAPGFNVSDGLGTYDEDYHSYASLPDKAQRTEKSAVTVSGIDHGAICAALGDVLNYLRGRAILARRVAYDSDSGIVRWYNASCVTNKRSEPTRTTNNSVDPVTLKELRRIVVTHPQEYLDAY